MSLLMDALKRADESKRHVAENGAKPTSAVPEPGDDLAFIARKTDHSFSPPSSDTPAEASADPQNFLSADEASLHARTMTDKPLDQQAPFLDKRPRPPAFLDRPYSLEKRSSSDQEAAHNLFGAKKKSSPSLAFWVSLAMVLAMTILTGWHFWRQYQRIRSQSFVVSSDWSARPPTGAQPQVIPPSAAVSGESPVLPDKARAPLEEKPQTSPTPGVFADNTPKERLVETPKGASPLPSDLPSRAPVRLMPDARVGETIGQAYAFLQAGMFDDATRYYERAYRLDPNQIDALLGLAVTAGRLGQGERAYSYYRRAFELDPQNPEALAGMINERGLSDPAKSESQILTRLAGRPGSPALFFALGNLYAAQSRWSEAREAYFNAHSIDPSNADYVFNLAVSCDYLNQTALAERYYRLAVEIVLAGRSVFSFDMDQAKNRIRALASNPGAPPEPAAANGP